MILDILMTQQVVIERPTWKTDPRNNKIADWDDLESSTTVDRCSVQPGPTEENLDRRDGVLIQWTAYLPAGTDVEATDRVRYQGVPYSIDGEPARWVTGFLDHVRVSLKRFEG